MKKMLLGLATVFSLTSVAACSNNTYDNEKLVVGLECAYSPFNWTETVESEHTMKIANASGYADGYDISIARYLGEKLDKEVEVKKIAWESLVESLKTNQINCIIAGMSYDEERDLVVDFTQNYYTSEMTIIVKKDSPLVNADDIQDFGGYKLGSQLGTLTDSIIDQVNNVTHYTAFEDFGKAALAVASGVIDGMTAEYPVAKGIVKANPSLAIVTFTKENGFKGLTDNQLGVAVAVKEGNKELQNLINGALSELSEADRKAMMDAALDRAPSAE